jgi:hypothetical protein
MLLSLRTIRLHPCVTTLALRGVYRGAIIKELVLCAYSFYDGVITLGHVTSDGVL